MSTTIPPGDPGVAGMKSQNASYESPRPEPTLRELHRAVQELRAQIEEVRGTQDIIISALQGSESAKEDVRNMQADSVK